MNKINIKNFETINEYDFYEMAALFYESDAVGKEINFQILSNTFNKCINKSPFIRGIFICFEDFICGYALLTFTYSNEYGGLIMFIDELYIKYEFRKKGIASYFISQVISEYKNNVACIELVVMKDNNAAINLYNKFGFIVSDFVTMNKDLS